MSNKYYISRLDQPIIKIRFVYDNEPDQIRFWWEEEKKMTV